MSVSTSSRPSIRSSGSAGDTHLLFGYAHRFDGKFTVRSGTSRIAPVIPDWDEDEARTDDLPYFPGSQLQVIIPKKVARP